MALVFICLRQSGTHRRISDAPCPRMHKPYGRPWRMLNAALSWPSLSSWAVAGGQRVEPGRGHDVPTFLIAWPDGAGDMAAGVWAAVGADAAAGGWAPPGCRVRGRLCGGNGGPRYERPSSRGRRMARHGGGPVDPGRPGQV